MRTVPFSLLMTTGSLLLGLLAPEASAMAPAPVRDAGARLTLSFDPAWRFLKGDAAGAEKPAFDDGAWRVVDVPHDWSIEGPFDRDNPARGAGAFLPTGVAWYRRHFELPAASAGRRVFIEFDGVMANSDVWINGVPLGHRPYGYSSFQYELTGHLSFGAGASNVLAVRADTSAQPASRWYTGSGIYRHVRLVVTDPVHLGHWATFVSTPQVAPARAVVHVQSSVVNQSPSPQSVSLQVTVLDPSGRPVQTVETAPQTIGPGQSADFQTDLPVAHPALWDLDRPDLYRAVARARSGGKLLDDETVAFGIREARFDADTGFWLNGRNLKILGVCVHSEGSAFGAAVPLGVWEHRLAQLRQLGVNAIRTAHNPPAPEFLDLCDRMGFLVMDENFDCWTVGKTPYDYHLYFDAWSKIDTRDMVRRDRNHPSIVVYSTGNEIHDTPKEELAKRILAGLVEVFHENDPTRPVTQALFRPNVSHDYTNGLADLLDVVGQNYRENEILAAHRQKPSRKILGTENTHEAGVWLALRDNPAYAGQFLWAGIDYLGESPRWPVIAAGFGLLQRSGTPRDRGFERASWWAPQPMVHVTRRTAPNPIAPTDPGYEPDPRNVQVQFADWTPRNAARHEENVEVYSNCQEVELILNGRSLGSQPLHADATPRTWKVAYEPGMLQAVARNGGKTVATDELRTAGAPAKLALSVDRRRLAPGYDEVAFVTVSVVDAHGVLVPTAGDLVTFKAAGPAVVAAVDSDDNASHEPFQADSRKAYEGLCYAYLKATRAPGRITLTASAPGLATATIALDAAAAPVPQK